MSDSSGPPHVDTQRLSDTGTYVYEAVATLEYTGRKPSREAIAAAADMDDEELDGALAELTRQGVLTTTGEGEATYVYVPARRDWSTQPGKAAGHPMQ
jgi:hypothetical protein